MNLNIHVISVIARRDLKLYFNNPTGYLFITVFIFLSAAAAFWQERFFANNLANLDQLNFYFPLLMLFFIPALTMNIWSEERRQGTDELLFTLPATDLDVVLGKYLAALGVYTAAVVISISHVIVLFWLGSPDLGLLFANYLGYWLMGAALLAVGMFASLLTANATIGFILGVLFCGIFIYAGSIEWLTGAWLQNILSKIAVIDYFHDFAKGIVSLSSLLYFIALAAVMIYVNVVIVGRRHWPARAGGYKMWVHHAVRAVSLGIAVFALVTIIGRLPLRFDVTAEQLHSLSRETTDLIRSLPEDRKVLIQAFISPEVPQNIVETRANLIGKLEEIDALAAGRVQVNIYDTEPYTEQARSAREKFGITDREMFVPGSASASNARVFMGVAFTSGAQEEVIPFFERGLPVEYELVRSIRSVAQAERKKIGVLATRAKLFGDFDFQSGRRQPRWQVVSELEKQYDVVMIQPDAPITEEVDALLVAMPSTLSDQQMIYLKNYITAGHPTIILADPMPLVDLMLSPVIPSDAQTNPFASNQNQNVTPKGDIASLMNDLGINWNHQQVIWDAYNPHPDISSLQQEVVFIGSGNKNPHAFNAENPVTSGLQEVVLMYPGHLQQPVQNTISFTPLLQTGEVSGQHQWFNLVQRGFFGLSINPNPRRLTTAMPYVVAARYRGTIPTADTTTAAEVNVIVISDIDFISDQFFQLRAAGIERYNFDNITFFLNSIDLLAGDESFIDLRKRRIRHRTLTAVEARTEEFIRRRLEQERQAEEEARQELSVAQTRLDEKVNDVRQRTDLDQQTKQIMVRNLQEVENKRFEAARTAIEARRDATIAAGLENMEMAIRQIQTRIKMMAVLIPPIPVFIMGVIIFVRRRRREYEGTIAARRLRS